MVCCYCLLLLLHIPLFHFVVGRGGGDVSLGMYMCINEMINNSKIEHWKE